MKIENNKVVNHRGDVMAEKVNGKWESKNPEALAFISESEAKIFTPKPKKLKDKKTG